MEESSYYTPEPEPTPIIIERIVEKFIEKPPMPISSQPLKIARIMGEGGENNEGYAESVASTEASASEKKWMKVSGVGDGKGTYWAGVEDSDDDDFDRMVMGRAGVGPPGRGAKGYSKKKALKWLGLS